MANNNAFIWLPEKPILWSTDQWSTSYYGATACELWLNTCVWYFLEQTHYICYNVAYIDLNGVFANKHESHYSPKKLRLLDSQTSHWEVKSMLSLWWIIITLSWISIVYLQTLQHNLVQPLVKAVALSLWTMLVVPGARPDLLTAPLATILLAVPIPMMQVPPV